jgi:cation diffusion facilitator family transporter
VLSELLTKVFVKNANDVKDKKVRDNLGYLGGFVGIVVNLLLFALKLTVGLIVTSIAVIADAFNNLSDAASSIVTILGFKISKIPADKEHPFGHGRMEYISALIVAFMVMLVGMQFVKSSFERILNPEKVTFELIPFLLLVISILLKVWLSIFNRYIGNRINSSALKAASVDALGDVFTSSCVVLSLLAAKYTSFPVDGYAGIIVSIVILYSGFSLVKETISPLLGEAPSPELVESINSSLLSYDHIIGVHDLIIHNYGVGKFMATIHAEIPADMNLLKIHNIVDRAEREISKKLGIMLFIHMDPISIDNEEEKKIRSSVNEIISSMPYIKSFHDLRIVEGIDEEKKNLIFDVVVDTISMNKTYTEDKVREDLLFYLIKIYPEYNFIITVDYQFY